MGLRAEDVRTWCLNIFLGEVGWPGVCHGWRWGGVDQGGPPDGVTILAPVTWLWAIF